MVKTKDNIVFIGGRDRGFECLKALSRMGIKIAAIFAMQEDEHEHEKFYKQIEKFAIRKKIPVKITNFVKSEEDIKFIKKLSPTLILVMGWRTLIPQEVLDIPKKGSVAVHESLLPKYRGFSPINWAIINGEEVIGVTLFYMSEGMDAGDIVGQELIAVGQDETAYDVYQKTKKASIDLTARYIKSLLSGTAMRIPQNEYEATFTCPRIPEDGQIDWNKTAREIHNLIRALSFPYPGAFTGFDGRRLYIQKASLSPNIRKFIGVIPGRTVLRGNGWVEILAGDRGILRIEKVQEEGGEIVDASTIIKSIRSTLGR